VDQLEHDIIRRAHRHLSEGVTTCEVKSGYGLNLAEELKMLTAICSANRKVSVDLIATCLAAHIKPRDFPDGEEEYLTHVLNEILPVVRRNNLANRVDIFIEQNAFSIGPSKRFLQAAKQSGFDLAVHADQFTPGGSHVAVEVGAVSADHLEASTAKEIEMLAKSDVIPVVLPGASLGLGCAFAPARKLLNHGASLVIATDWNPGSAPMGDLLAQAAIISAFEKLNTAETLAAITSRAAAALRVNNRGSLINGNLADIIAFETDDYREILYHQGKLKPARIWCRGTEV
jgi:imidazolonepropionase